MKIQAKFLTFSLDRFVSVDIKRGTCICKYAISNKISRVCLDWLQSLKQFFINVPYHIPVASPLKQFFINVPYHILVASPLKQFFINVPYHILAASLTLMALF